MTRPHEVHGTDRRAVHLGQEEYENIVTIAHPAGARAVPHPSLRTRRAPRVGALLTVLLAAIALMVIGVAAPAAAADDEEWGFIPRVVDADSAGVAGALVSVSDESGEVIAETTTDENGTGETLSVPDAGVYVITVDTSAIDVHFEGGDVYAVSRELGAANTLPIQRLVVSLTETANAGVISDAGGESSGAAASVSAAQIAQQLASGLSLGLILAVATLGMALISGTTRLMNFAYGESLTIGALAAFFASAVLGLPVIVAALFAIAAGVLLHFLQDLLLWRPARRKGVAIVPLMIASMGVAMILRYLGYALFGGSAKRVSPATIPSLRLGPIVFPISAYIGAGVAIVAVCLVMWWLRSSHAGRAIRAVAANRPLAAATGVDVDHTIRLVWLVSGALAGLAGILLALLSDVTWDMGFKALLLIFAAMILGGVGTPAGAVFGAIAVGVLTELLVLWLPSDMKYVGALGVLIIVLLVRPQGLFGTRERIG
ncbi:branched-chain amino acid ABC transporter permease [Microbacterium sp.]|uniref:branched-chain amino acid ABC transporter permease n=1 Tax=Microbacterium sp. TaxID=51671 RepID=UPI0039E23B91